MTDSKKASGQIRSPLSPIDTSVQRNRSIRMDNASDVSDLQQVSLFDFGESEFELMHVKVTVHALTGMLSEKERTKTKKAIAALTPRSMKKELSVALDDSFASSLSSMSSNGPRNDKKDKNPTLAVASFGRNVTSSQTSIKTHLPSLPLGIPTSSFGYVNRYMAQWKEPKPLFLQEGEVDDQSSFTFLRVMMREPTENKTEVYGANTVASKYVHETLDIEINLSRGKEIIPLGVATLAITGDEEGPHQMNLPARAVVFKGNKTIVGNSVDVKKSRGLFKKKVKRAAFASDPKRKYFLDENATLRVTVNITPQEAINDARAKEQAKAMVREQMEKMKKQMELEMECQDENNNSIVTETHQTLNTCSSDSESDIPHKNQENNSHIIFSTGLFCNSAACSGTEEKNKGDSLCMKEEKSEDYSVDTSAFDQMVQEKYGYSLASSVLSSVSESDSSSDESVDGDIHINRKIVVRKKKGRKAE